MCRFVYDQYVRFCDKPFRHRNLLLIAAAEIFRCLGDQNLMMEKAILGEGKA